VSLLRIVKKESFYLLEFLLVLFLVCILVIVPFLFIINYLFLGMSNGDFSQIILTMLIIPLILMIVWLFIFDCPLKLKLSLVERILRKSPSY